MIHIELFVPAYQAVKTSDISNAMKVFIQLLTLIAPSREGVSKGYKISKVIPSSGLILGYI